MVISETVIRQRFGRKKTFTVNKIIQGREFKRISNTDTLFVVNSSRLSREISATLDR